MITYQAPGCPLQDGLASLECPGCMASEVCPALARPVNGDPLWGGTCTVDICRAAHACLLSLPMQLWCSMLACPAALHPFNGAATLHAGYLRLSTDICDIKAAIGTSDNPNYAEARKIYVDGKNSYKNDGTIRTLRGGLFTLRVTMA